MIKKNPNAAKDAEAQLQYALKQTGEWIIADIIEADIIPYRKGTLEGTLKPLDVSNIAAGEVYIHSNTPYARRLYFNPEYNFNKEMNPNAQAYWFEPWIKGSRRKDVDKIFAASMKAWRKGAK